MLKRTQRNKISLFGLALLLPFFASAAPPKYPLVSSFSGEAFLTGRDGQKVPINKKQILQDKALLEAGASGEVRVELDEKRAFVVLPNSEVSLPVISFDGGEAPVLFLRKGSFRWEQAVGERGSYNVALRSDIFEFIAPPGDYVLSIDPAKAYASVKVLEGQLNFSALNGEDSVLVKAGQQVGFQGVLEEGEIAYDILLKGKKIPKGKLTPVSNVDPSELGKRAEAEKKRQEEKARKIQQEKANAAKAKAAGFICDKPGGKFNQCSWVCENNPRSEKKRCLAGVGSAICVRQRCNANGVWAERTELDAEKGSTFCKSTPVVAACDY